MFCLFIWLGWVFAAELGLLASLGERGLLPGCDAHRLPQLRGEHRVDAAPGLWGTGSVVVAQGLACSVARGIFPDQGSNPCLLHCQADSLPLSQWGSPSH